LTRPNISQRYLKGFEIPVPPLEEQAEIVSRVADMASAVAKLETALMRSRVQAGRLRRTVINRVVSGSFRQEATTQSELTSVSD